MLATVKKAPAPSRVEALALRCENAMPAEQRLLIIQTFEALNPCPAFCEASWAEWLNRRAQLKMLLDAEAYESAVIRLLADDWCLYLQGETLTNPCAGEKHQHALFWAEVHHRDKCGRRSATAASSMALAVCAAALRLHAMQQQRQTAQQQLMLAQLPAKRPALRRKI